MTIANTHAGYRASTQVHSSPAQASASSTADDGLDCAVARGAIGPIGTTRAGGAAGWLVGAGLVVLRRRRRR